MKKNALYSEKFYTAGINFQQFQCKITFVECRSCTFTKNLQESALLSQIYTDGKNFTQPPVATVMTNLNSAKNPSYTFIVVTHFP